MVLFLVFLQFYLSMYNPFWFLMRLYVITILLSFHWGHLWWKFFDRFYREVSWSIWWLFYWSIWWSWAINMSLMPLILVGSIVLFLLIAILRLLKFLIDGHNGIVGTALSLIAACSALSSWLYASVLILNHIVAEGFQQFEEIDDVGWVSLGNFLSRNMREVIINKVG